MAGVLIGMSGGVDSSTAVMLLQERGFETAGATLVLHRYGACGEDVANAKQAAETLGIPFFVIDGEERFSETVIRPFGEAYARGETPNPCVFCNRGAKFPLLLEKADRLSLPFIATGHYAKKEYDPASGRHYLRRADDEQKDQTYVLWSLGQEALARCLFPMGTMKKSDVRSLAAKRSLLSAVRPESQDICFVPDGDYAAFLERTLGLRAEPGDFTDLEGNVLGRHRGLLRYTIGQRRGLGVSAAARLFVLEKNMEKNTVVLGPPEALFSKRMEVRGVNWMAVAPPAGELRAQVKARYRQEAQPARIVPLSEDRALVEFDAAQRAVTAGQSAVFYDGDVLLGGGFIASKDV